MTGRNFRQDLPDEQDFFNFQNQPGQSLLSFPSNAMRFNSGRPHPERQRIRFPNWNILMPDIQNNSGVVGMGDTALNEHRRISSNGPPCKLFCSLITSDQIIIFLESSKAYQTWENNRYVLLEEN